jgi:hypothetical protein
VGARAPEIAISSCRRCKAPKNDAMIKINS